MCLFHHILQKHKLIKLFSQLYTLLGPRTEAISLKVLVIINIELSNRSSHDEFKLFNMLNDKKSKVPELGHTDHNKNNSDETLSVKNYLSAM